MVDSTWHFSEADTRAKLIDPAMHTRGWTEDLNARVVIATYQTLDVGSDESDANFLRAHYPENYFTHIVIDECHRSAWGKWSEVMRRNPDAMQVGLTATPRQFHAVEPFEEAIADEHISADTVRHFGEPVYEYDMSQGIEDRYLAACEIVRRDIFLDEQERSERETLPRRVRRGRARSCSSTTTGWRICRPRPRRR